MAIYDQADFAGRILSLLPQPWFSDAAVNPGGLAYATAFSLAKSFYDLYVAIAYEILQTRIATATDINLDIISADFLGGTCPRLPNEPDNSYRARIVNSILATKSTRSGVTSTLNNLGYNYTLIEDGTADCGAWGVRNGLGTFGALGAGGRAQSAIYLTVFNPLPSGMTITALKATLNLVKAEGTQIWLAVV